MLERLWLQAWQDGQRKISHLLHSVGLYGRNLWVYRTYLYFTVMFFTQNIFIHLLCTKYCNRILQKGPAMKWTLKKLLTFLWSSLMCCWSPPSNWVSPLSPRNYKKLFFFMLGIRWLSYIWIALPFTFSNMENIPEYCLFLPSLWVYFPAVLGTVKASWLGVSWGPCSRWGGWLLVCRWLHLGTGARLHVSCLFFLLPFRHVYIGVPMKKFQHKIILIFFYYLSNVLL